MHHRVSQWAYRLVAGLLALGLLATVWPPQVLAQTPQAPSASAYQSGPASAAQINELARQVHILNLRSGTTTRWIGGDLGVQGATTPSVPAGTQLTDWRFRDIYDEAATVSLDDLDRPVLINIWASWCGPCRFEFPYLTDIALNQTTNYDLWFLNAGDTSESAARRFLRSQADVPHLYYDTGDAFSTDIRMRFFPTTLMMDTDGTIIALHVGVVRPTVMAFFDALASNPRAGSIDTSTIEVGDLVADIQPADPAQAEPIIYGQQVTNTITDEDWQHNYRFEGQAGETVTITMNSTVEDFDAYLVLIGPDGERVAENDDGPSPPNAYISTSLPADGTYVIVATRFLEAEGFSQGGFTLKLERGEATEQDDSGFNATTALQPNVPVSGQLSRDRTQDTYTFTGVTGQNVTFALTHDQPSDDDHLNLQVRLGSERIVPFTATEDGELEAQVTLPTDDTYSVYVSRPMSSRAAPITYTLTARTVLAIDALDDDDSGDESSSATDQPEEEDEPDTEADAPPDPDEEASPPEQDDGDLPELVVISYGDEVVADLSPDVENLEYAFEGAEGDVISVSMEAIDRDLDPLLVLYGPTGSIFAANDDNGRTTDSLIPAYRLPMDGDYVIVATRFGGDSAIGGSGEFRLTLNRETETASSAGPVTPPRGSDGDSPYLGPDSDGAVESTTIDIGQTATGEIDDAVYEVQYRFEGQAGMRVAVQMQATDGTLDAYLSLETESGKQLAFNDDDRRQLTADATITDAMLPEDGTYVIRATRYGGRWGGTSGTFRLTLNASEAETTGRITNSTAGQNPVREFMTQVDDIEPDGSVQGQLSFRNSPVGYAFQGEPNMVVTIDLVRVSGTLDAGIILVDPLGEVVDLNESYTGPTNARLSNIRLRRSGEYLIVVGLDDEETSGGFLLSLTVE